MMPIEVDTHIPCLIKFERGVIGSNMMSFDVWDGETPGYALK
ncbi:MAG: hypothetical protein QNJ16_01925 [Rhodobacter sp.]|nr:hypothetical protein [Rhodobacter sp.]